MKLKAEELAELLDGNLWQRYGKTRIYLNFGIKSPKITEKVWLEKTNNQWVPGAQSISDTQTPEFLAHRRNYLKTIAKTLYNEAISQTEHQEIEPLQRLIDPYDYELVYFTKPYHFQIEPLQKSLEFYSYYLAMDMGLGKSKIAIDNYLTRELHGVANTMVVLTASSLKVTFAKQVEEHSDLQYSILDSKLQADNEVIICAYEQMSTPYRQGRYFEYLQEILKDKKYLLVLDETSFINNDSALRTQNILALSKKASFVLCLNGTPISNCISDLWTQYYAMDGSGEILDAQTAGNFKDKHVITYSIYNYVRDIGYKDKDKVMQRIAPYTYQLKKEDVLQLPDTLEKNYYFQLTNSQKKALNKVYNIIQPDLKVFNPNAIMRYLAYVHQISHGRTSELLEFEKLKSNKPKLLQDLLHIYQFDKLIIFCNYIDEIAEIKRHVKGYNLYVLSGDTADKQSVEKDFELDKKPSILMATFGVGGRGKNWQFCNNMLFYSPSWSYAKLAQAKDRIHRIGQEHKCRYFYFYANSFIDECMIKAVNRKMDLENYLYEYLNQDNLPRFFSS